MSGYQPGQASDLPTPPGVLAGAVLRAARRSARAAPGSLASGIELTVDTYLSMEEGIISLAGVPVPMIENLKSGLQRAGANLELVADLDVAAWGDSSSPQPPPGRMWPACWPIPLPMTAGSLS